MLKLYLTASLILIAGAFLIFGLAGFVLPNLLLRRKPRFNDIGGTLLSFDDGPDPVVTNPLLDVLAANQAKACFFVLADQAQRHPQLIERIMAEGHTIGLHGYRHHSHLNLNWVRQWRELEKGYRILSRLGCRICLFRPPHGMHSLVTHIFCLRHGLLAVHWHGLVQDWLVTDVSILVRRLLNLAGNGHVLVLHDGCAGKADPAAHLVIPQVTQFFLSHLCLPNHLANDWRSVERRATASHIAETSQLANQPIGSGFESDTNPARQSRVTTGRELAYPIDYVTRGENRR